MRFPGFETFSLTFHRNKDFSRLFKNGFRELSREIKIFREKKRLIERFREILREIKGFSRVFESPVRAPREPREPKGPWGALKIGPKEFFRLL
jgi:hypothetical protein